MGIFSIFFNMKVYCVFSFESPYRGDSNEYTQYTKFNIKKRKNTVNYPKSAAMGFFHGTQKNGFEIAVVNEPSVFEPMKFYCIYLQQRCFATFLISIRCWGLQHCHDSRHPIVDSRGKVSQINFGLSFITARA